MILRACQPAPPLARFVECFWYMDGYACLHQRERALPTGTVEVVFSLRDDPFRIFTDDADTAGQQFRGSVVCGPQSRYFVLETRLPGPVIGIHFRPGGAAPFFAVPAGELADRHVDLQTLWGPQASELRERFLEAKDTPAMFALLEQALLARLLRSMSPHPAVTLALREFGAMPSVNRVAGIREEAGYGAKRFIELFRDSVGLTPKRYCRILRFQAVIRELARGRRVEWAAAALDGGYCDQSHLNREFRAFAGLTPTEYHPVAADRPSHVAVM